MKFYHLFKVHMTFLLPMLAEKDHRAVFKGLYVNGAGGSIKSWLSVLSPLQHAINIH